MAKEISYQSTIELLQFGIENDQVMSTLAAADNTVTEGAASTYPKGDRVLCLDGGGIKGLVLIEMLAAIERISGKRIVDLFDWIIGTSTGGILALALVYSELCFINYMVMLNNILADLTLDELRRMYFSLKDKVLHSIGIPHSDTEALEIILKDKVKEAKLGSRTHPKYVTYFVLMAFQSPSNSFIVYIMDSSRE